MLLSRKPLLLLLVPLFVSGHDSAEALQLLEPSSRSQSLQRVHPRFFLDHFFGCVGCTIACSITLELCVTPCFLLPEGGTVIVGVCAVSQIILLYVRDFLVTKRLSGMLFGHEVNRNLSRVLASPRHELKTCLFTLITGVNAGCYESLGIPGKHRNLERSAETHPTPAPQPNCTGLTQTYV